MSSFKLHLKHFLQTRSSILGIVIASVLLDRTPSQSIIFYLAYRFNVLFYLWRKRGLTRYMVTQTGVLILFYSKKAVKIPLSASAESDLLKNYHNYTLIKGNSLRELVSYKLHKISRLYVMDILTPANETKEELEVIREKLYAHSYFQAPKIISLKDVLDKAVEKVPPLEQLRDKIEHMHAEHMHSYALGPTHGDLIGRNIMYNKLRSICMIDLDRFDMHGIMLFDTLHDDIYRLCKKRNINFFEYFSEKNNENELECMDWLYFIHRVCLEYGEVNRVSPHYKKNLNKFLNQVK